MTSVVNANRTRKDYIADMMYEGIMELVRIAKKRALDKFDVELNMEWKVIQSYVLYLIKKKHEEVK